MEINYDNLNVLLKYNPEFEAIIQKMNEENKNNISFFVHELKNPLALMKSTIQYIETKHPEAKNFKYWNQLLDLMDDLENMLNDASLLNKCSTASKQETDLIALITSLKENYMPQAINRQVRLELTTAPGCEPYFSSYHCDPAKIKQAITNLIKNAFEAVTAGSLIRICLDYFPCTTDSSDKLSIRISNNGKPIPADEIDSIFTPFITYKKGGTGIGLALVKKIIELHFGSIHVESSSELTSFTILLPL